MFTCSFFICTRNARNTNVCFPTWISFITNQLLSHDDRNKLHNNIKKKCISKNIRFLSQGTLGWYMTFFGIITFFFPIFITVIYCKAISVMLHAGITICISISRKNNLQPGVGIWHYLRQISLRIKFSPLVPSNEVSPELIMHVHITLQVHINWKVEVFIKLSLQFYRRNTLSLPLINRKV